MTENKRLRNTERDRREKLGVSDADFQRLLRERTASLQRQTRCLRRLSRALFGIEHRERQRLAHLLHNGLLQILVAAKMQLQMKSTQGDDDTSGIVLGLMDEAIEAARSVANELGRPDPRDLPLPIAIGWLARSFSKYHFFDVTVEAPNQWPQMSGAATIVLFNAVRELLFNTERHSGVREASVHLEVPDDDSVRIVVSDKGRGFDPSTADDDSSDHSGSGLICIREQLSVLGGTLRIEAAPGRGARLVVTIPATTATDILRVIIIDDDTLSREGLSSLLCEQADFDLVGDAADGAEGVVLAEKLQPDVVIMDINMPRSDGIEATRRIKRSRPDTTIVALSSSDEQEKVDAIIRAGAAACLPRQAGSASLFQTIRELCRKGSGR